MRTVRASHLDNVNLELYMVIDMPVRCRICNTMGRYSTMLQVKWVSESFYKHEVEVCYNCKNIMFEHEIDGGDIELDLDDQELFEDTFVYTNKIVEMV